MLTYNDIKSKLINIGQIAIEHGSRSSYKELRNRIVVTKNVSSVLFEVVYNGSTVNTSFNLEDMIISYNSIEVEPKFIFQPNIIMESETGRIMAVKLSNHAIISHDLGYWANTVTKATAIKYFDIFIPNWGKAILDVWNKSSPYGEDLTLVDNSMNATYISSDYFAVYIGE